MALGAKVSSTARFNDTIRGDGFSDPAFQVGFPSGLKMLCALWDDSVDGHLPIQVANGGMGLGVFAPKNFHVFHAHGNVLVVPVGPTSVGASLENDFDVSASAAVAGAPWSTVGFKNLSVIDTDAAQVAVTTQITTTVARELQLVATVAVSSAGRIAIYLEGVLTPVATQGA